MPVRSRPKISLYEEAKAGLISLLWQTATVFLGLLFVIFITGGYPSEMAIALSFVVGVIFVAWSEKRRLDLLNIENPEIFPASIESTVNDVLDATEQKSVNLSQWFQKHIANDWQALDILRSQTGTDFARVREGGINRGKIIDLGISPENQVIILVVGIDTKENKKNSIAIQVYPSGRAYLPSGIKLAILNESEEPILYNSGKPIEEQAKHNSYLIQVYLIGSRDEKFKVKITLSSTVHQEEFII